MIDLLKNLKNKSPAVELRLRNDIYQFAQKQHLAASLFSLDEIAIVPKVITPLVLAGSSIELAPTDSVSLSVPYVPDWPELGAVYNASTMTLVDALQGGANIILAGHSGSGKTVALAWLASALARNLTGFGILEGLLPLYVHAQDLQHFIHYKEEAASEPEGTAGTKSKASNRRGSNPEPITDDVTSVLIRSISSYASPLTLPRLPGIIRSALEKQHAILLLDGMDELPPDQSLVLTKYLKSVLDKYPELRVVVSMSYEDLARLPALEFSLLGLAAWGDYERAAFLGKWSRLWAKWVSPIEKNKSNKINTHYLNSWLKVNNSLLNPLEFVLKVWAAYAGDIRGTDGPSVIESYILRMTNQVTNARNDLEQFALEQLLGIVTSSVDSAENTSEDQQTSIPTPDSAEGEAETATPSQPVAGRHSIKRVPNGADVLLENGFMVSYSGSRYHFSHPIIAGYLASNAVSASNSATQLLNLPPCIGKSLAMYYLAYIGDITPLLNPMIQDDDIIHSSHLQIARWLQIAPRNRPWRSIVLRTLTTILQKEKDTLSLAAKIISAMAFSGDAGVSYYFRQLIKSDHSNLKQLAALGCGIIGDKKAIPDLNEMLQNQSPGSVRAASLALAAVGDKQSLEILASSLLSGNELLRRCAAEALANDPLEGHPALKDGSEMEDLLVRRASAFGLMRVNLPWATKIVENMQLEDNEWVVRNAAIQAFDELKRKNSLAPRPMQDLTEAQWLIDYAARIGTSVAPGKPAHDLAVKALANGTQDEILNSLDYLLHKCDPKTMAQVFIAYSNNSGEIKDIAYHVLWLMMIAGMKLPISIKYNIS